MHERPSPLPSRPPASWPRACASPFEAAKGGVRLRVRLVPKARREGLMEVALDAAGTAHLRVAVAAPAEDGKANRALLRLLAREWRLPASRLAIVAGARSRNKTVALAGDPRELLAQLTRWLEERHG